MKQLFYAISIAVLLLITATACGDDEPNETIIDLSSAEQTEFGYFDGQLYYMPITETEVKVNKAHDNVVTVDIPSKVKLNGHTFTVTSIGNYAFSDCENLTIVNIPNCVSGIGEGAFWGCSNLFKINLPDGLAEINSDAFSYCNKLETLIVPNSVTKINEKAFFYCGLKSVVLGSSLTELGSGVFIGCYGLKEITSLNTIPPKANDGSFVLQYGSEQYYKHLFQRVTLYVPKSAIDAYKAANGWSHFETIAGK